MSESQGDTNLKERTLPAQNGRLAGKTAVVTGAAGNLGSQICRAFAREGANVVMTGRTQERIDAAREALIKDTGVAPERVSTAILDGGNPESIREALASVQLTYG
ncbi:MAG: SDR family NAD(P)-dependent oxidoreductase, partial [Pseudomonadota bacterium]